MGRLFFYKLSKKLRVTSFLFIIAYFIYFFFNIIYTGGIVSPLIIWLILLPILAITLNNNLILYSIIGCFLVLGVISGLNYFDIHFPNEIAVKNRNNFFNSINFMVCVMIIIFSYDKRKQMDNEKLEQSNADLEQFAYVASHDMKAPLRNIMNFTQLLQRKNKNKLDPERGAIGNCPINI